MDYLILVLWVIFKIALSIVVGLTCLGIGFAGICLIWEAL